MLTLSDYRRAFQIMHGILLSEDATPEKACLFFAMAGAKIMSSHYKIEAIPVAGCAFFMVEEASASVLSYAELKAEGARSTSNAFHAWVQCGDWGIDFMAPLFPDAAARAGLRGRTPRHMFQRQLTEMASSHLSLQHAGDFFLAPNPELTIELVGKLRRKPANEDLENIACQWFKKVPKKIPIHMPVSDARGKIKRVTIGKVPVEGAW